MVKHLLALAGAGMLSAPSLLSLELSPTPGFRMLEGFKVPIVTLRDGEKTVRWQPPGDWKLGGDATKLLLSSPDFAGATMELQVIQREPDGRDLLTTPEQRQVWLRRFLPKDAKDIIMVTENSGPFTLAEHPSSEIVFEFASQARRVSSSISFVDLNERERLVLNVTALKADFAPVRDAAIASMFSWSWVE